jgi:hypothetical protein
VIGNSADAFATNTTIATTGATAPFTSLRLDFDGTTATAFINGVQVAAVTLATLGITLDTASGNVYEAGYCGEAKTPGIDTFAVYTA